MKKINIECVSDFIDKHVEVRHLDDFTIYGVIKEIDSNGIVLASRQKTTFISFNNIKLIQLDTKVYDHTRTDYGSKAWMEDH